MQAVLDWRFVEGEEWRIHVKTEDGRCVELCDGGSLAQLLRRAPRHRLPHERAAALITRRVPIENWPDALKKQPDDVKVVILPSKVER